MPLAEIARRVGFERAPHGRPVTVGRDHVTRATGSPVAEQDFDLVVTGRELLDRALLAHVDTAAPRQRDERGVEVAAGDHGRVQPVGRKRQRDPPPAR